MNDQNKEAAVAEMKKNQRKLLEIIPDDKHSEADKLFAELFASMSILIAAELLEKMQSGEVKL